MRGKSGQSQPAISKMVTLWHCAFAAWTLVVPGRHACWLTLCWCSQLPHMGTKCNAYRTPSCAPRLGHALVAVRAHAVVLLPLLGVPQRVVRLGHLLELLCSPLVTLQPQSHMLRTCIGAAGNDSKGGCAARLCMTPLLWSPFIFVPTCSRGTFLACKTGQWQTVASLQEDAAFGRALIPGIVARLIPCWCQGGIPWRACSKPS